ncbi:hydroxymethylpyrimidine kinase /phosphomethylpyrimidine kinase [Motilibacter rhizosphaerae]|uniref:Hydroxymethylpyrimidine kinase /phosphomethylpyrimidine kinase n=1 Tax=Motilibacter rhizosphaerae TaxID=598652 RepID=A0A4Q7NPX8_9ACTN|nr:bifunctional hydroxymethylpyrimidine kinase/phosphomethylpyrimidine kinase [Motilibacter rhizosphaerae]RZS87036.1 hydroxymethylpyrimidine kinase /phosphomethylpyrimidine kinase [Motilibacter rhizosphaerae]
MSAPVALSVAGSDPSGGAGMQADLKAFSAMGAYAAAVVTALTAQNTLGVQGIFPVPAEFVQQQLDSVLSDLDVAVLKTGMLGSPEVVEVVAEAVARHDVPVLVVDPVMVATSGDRLVSEETVDAVRELLLPHATLVTPNLPEAATLLGWTEVTEARMPEAAEALRRSGAGAVLVKGGHLVGDTSTDVLVDDDGALAVAAQRVDTANTHGTGCTLASAVAALLAQGVPLRDAVQEAKAYLTRAIAAADGLGVGHGHGPVHHFVDWWEPSRGRR